jgi:hypothetical protein
MPSIITASQPITNFPNRFISPFGDDVVVPLYSSVPLFNPQKNCLPCAACGNFTTRNVIIQQEAERFKDYVPYSSTSVEVNVGLD